MGLSRSHLIIGNEPHVFGELCVTKGTCSRVLYSVPPRVAVLFGTIVNEGMSLLG